MGEYAKRKIDGKEFKIGTCEEIFNCRYDQRYEVVYPYMSDNLYWRIPTPDEDGTLPGDFNYSLLREDGYIPWKLMIDTSKFSNDDIADMQQTGIIQLKEPKMGLLVNIRCPHGFPMEQFKINKEGTVISMGYNGHKDTLYLKGLKNEPSELKVLVECSACRHMWSFSFNEIEPLIESIWMRLRLLRQISDYHYQRSEEKVEFSVKVNVGKDSCATICSIGKGRYLVKKDEYIKADAPWHIALVEFVKLLPRTSDFDIDDTDARMSKLYNIASQAEEIRSNINNI
jgi:hypothetical protein|nr:MAG TPA: RNA polymerase-like protein [Caudoviricetes sp.]